MIEKLHLLLLGAVMPEKKAIEKFMNLDGDQKSALLTQLVFSGVHPVDFYVASVLILLPERAEELIAKAEQLLANPSSIPPLFPR
jgi:hypothetical protein